STQHPHAVRADDLTRTVGGAIVYDQHLVAGANRLCQRCQRAVYDRFLVVSWNEYQEAQPGWVRRPALAVEKRRGRQDCVMDRDQRTGQGCRDADHEQGESHPGTSTGLCDRMSMA